MTREEAFRLAMRACEETWNEKTCKQIKEALEQEPVLDKIRAEIEASKWTNKDIRIERNAHASGLDKALDIIDKYKAESEE